MAPDGVDPAIREVLTNSLATSPNRPSRVIRLYYSTDIQMSDVRLQTVIGLQNANAASG
jgi:hypothetical protein